MAFAALISLHHTIRQLLYSSNISIASPGLEKIKSTYQELDFLEKVVERLDSRGSMEREKYRETENDVEVQIRESVYRLEDVLESHISDQLVSQSGGRGDEGCPLMLSLDSEEMTQAIKSFAEMVKVVNNYSPETMFQEEKDDYASSEVVDSVAKKSEMVELVDEFKRIKSSLTSWMMDQLCVVSLEGMAGIGKTALAQYFFEDPLVCHYFDIRVRIKHKVT